MAEGVVSVTLQILGDLLLQEAKFLCDVGSEVKELQAQLKELKCLLEDADTKQHKNKRGKLQFCVRNWITEIKDLARKAEDIIETYAVQVSYSREMGFKHLLKTFSCVCLNGGFLLHNIGSEILRIKAEIARVKQSMQQYGIKSIIEGESSTEDQNQRWKRQTYANFEMEDCFVGKEDELKQLVNLILDNKRDRVITVWGMGGIGKTTICRKVYNHVEIKRRFESFAWKCKIRSVLEDVLKQLTPQKREKIMNLSNTELIDQLCMIQKVKRCMIVIDDLWEKDHWDWLKHAFLVEGLNSKILITTRKQSVAEVGFGFTLGLLNVDDGWELLKKKAFSHGRDPG
ncbi:hypothetical protein CDL12_20316 [Handroanthus impetiginosus]|uniref:NB-ARC domain-containing protein n=1 Tax=Handroanthus impetiginosus TaxID=429701 RepID=A0A2G9GPA3_9LAMI|nr:hypothetical protein CDL12_20316 [Handroanthus impetiginosus]